MTPTDIHALLSHGEHQTLEVKEAQGGLPNSIWATYSAFANTNGGTILLGIQENRNENDLHKRFTIIGVNNADKILKDLWNLLNDSDKVNVNLLTENDCQIINIDGKTIISIQVPRADYLTRPIYINGNIGFAKISVPAFL